MKAKNEKKQREIESILTSNKEIQEVKRKIEESYLSKERAKQLAETQYRKIDELVRKLLISDQRGIN
jgi:inosine/xanthosine triphosphate pyrophosphatase family protein